MTANNCEQARPIVPQFNLDAIPTDLRALPQWVGWRFEQRDERWAKTPIRCSTGRRANVTDPARWATYEEAVECYRRGKLDGVGFAFADGGMLTGIDLDKCRDPESGELEPWAEEIVTELDSYTEVSPSMRGLKVFVRGGLPEGAGRRRGKVEMYSRARFFTVTGHHLAGTPRTVESRQEGLLGLHTRLFGARSAIPALPNGRPLHGLTDDEIVARAMASANGEKFRKLWAGDVLGYGSDSEADLALCGILAFWAGPDGERIERLFARSGLAGREKWVRDVYRRRTIEVAIQGQAAFYGEGGEPSLFTRGTRSIQNIRNHQDDTGLYYTVHPHVAERVEVEGYSFPLKGQPLSPDKLSREEGGQGEGGDLAIELADTHGNAPDWQASFRLARRLRTQSADTPEQFEGAVAAFCERTGREFEPFWYAVLDAWDKVKYAEGDDVFAWATEEAARSPYPVTPCPGPRYQMVASIAYHLSRHTAGEPFWLPRERLAALLGFKHGMDISRVVSLLEKNGVIECVDASYSYRDGKAKEYVFIGDQGVGAAPAA
ncbi:hypothetical protein AB1L88_19720 [Tautonia sp. JC769]|uniref:phage NrS-1 polymerase family protein n=1 Tax=Tautonia sp. JC769 TaxID=3232135 RepID=UPI0034598C32